MTDDDAPTACSADFWQRDGLREALTAQHFGRVVWAYRHAHNPPLTQGRVGRWLGISQAQVSRMEKPGSAPPSDLRKLQRWAAILRIPPDLLWFAATHTASGSATDDERASLDRVDRRNLIKLTGAGAALVAAPGILNNTPWQRLSASLAGHRPADSATVSMIESRTAEFFRSEETLPARQLVTSLRTHYQAVRKLITTTVDDSLRHRLMTSAGEAEALAGWTLFDLQRPREAVQHYRNAVESARKAGDGPLVACVLGFWSYLLGAQGDVPGAVRMLTDATTEVRGSAVTTQSWISARLAEEHATLGESTSALQSLDRAITVFDYATPNERPWTCFFTPSRLGSLAVSTYSRMAHPDTDHAASTLLDSLAPAVLAAVPGDHGRAGWRQSA